MPESRGIALFDLDGTLLPWDCQLLFRHYVVRREPWRGLFLPVFLAFLPLAPWLGAARMKRVFFSFLAGMPPAAIETHARGFARFILPAVYPELLAAIDRHRAAGDLLVLASASPEFYVREIGRELGFNLALGTPVRTGPLFPELQNHKGAAKVARLREVLPPSAWADGKLLHSHGYSDSRADLPMLELCTTATLVNPAPSLAAHGSARGWSIVRPQRPWRGRAGFALRALALLTGLGRNPAAIPEGG